MAKPRLAIIETPGARQFDDGLGPLIEELQRMGEEQGYDVYVAPNVGEAIRWINGTTGSWVIWTASPEGDELAATERRGIKTMIVTRESSNPWKVSRTHPAHLDIIRAII